MFMGILNAIFVPFIVLYLIMYSFFRYFAVRHLLFVTVTFAHSTLLYIIGVP